MRGTRPQLMTMFVACAFALGAGGCKKRDAESKEDAIRSDRGVMEVMAPDRDVMAPDQPRKPGPKTLTFEEQVKLSIPLDPKPAALQVGKLTLEPERCAIEGIEFIGSDAIGLLKDLAILGKKLYVVNQKQEVVRFDIEDGAACRLKLDLSWGDQGTYKAPFGVDRVSVDARGNLVLSGIMGISYHDSTGSKLYDCQSEPHGWVSLHPSGAWGLAYYVNADVSRYEFTPKACKSAAWVLQPLTGDAKTKGPFSLVLAVAYLGDLVLVGGVLVEKPEPRVVLAMDTAGKIRFRMGAPGKGDDHFDWINGIAVGKQARICVVDSNESRMTVWTEQGAFQGAVDLAQLFGVVWPKIGNLVITPPGVGWFAVAGYRKLKGRPESTEDAVTEGLIYRVRGL